MWFQKKVPQYKTKWQLVVMLWTDSPRLAEGGWESLGEYHSETDFDSYELCKEAYKKVLEALHPENKAVVACVPVTREI